MLSSNTTGPGPGGVRESPRDGGDPTKRQNVLNWLIFCVRTCSDRSGGQIPGLGEFEWFERAPKGGPEIDGF